MTQLLLYLLLFLVGVVAGIVISVWVAHKRIDNGTMLIKSRNNGWQGQHDVLVNICSSLLLENDIVLKDQSGRWTGTEEAKKSLTIQLLHTEDDLHAKDEVCNRGNPDQSPEEPGTS
jgi:hypothetical protein